MSYKQDTIRYFQAADRLNIHYDVADKIRRDAQRLDTWNERECNGEIERDDETGKTYTLHNIDGPGPIRRFSTPDRETPALKRIAALAERYGATFEHNGDPRGLPVTFTWPDGTTLTPPVRY